MIKPMIFRSLVLSIFVVGLIGCMSGTKPSDNYTGSNGVVTPITSDREHCIKSCNDEYGRCEDSDAAHRAASDNAPADLFGARADCRTDLQKCLPRCKGL